MQTTQTKVEYSGNGSTTKDDCGIVKSKSEDLSILRHPTSLAINSNYRLHQRDRVNRFTTNATPNSPESSSSPMDFESVSTTTTTTSSSSQTSSLTPPPITFTKSVSSSYQKSSISDFLSGVKQRLQYRQKLKQQRQQQQQQQSPGIRPEEDLLQWKDMPKYLQFNPYVLTGYRPLTTFKGCCFSLFYWHNETVNIFTHGKFLKNF